MGVITIHLPSDVEKGVRKASAAAGLSVSAWIAEAARRRLEQRAAPSELTRWFGAFPEFELPTRRERWSKDET